MRGTFVMLALFGAAAARAAERAPLSFGPGPAALRLDAPALVEGAPGPPAPAAGARTDEFGAQFLRAKVRVGWMPWIHPWGQIKMAPDAERPFNQPYHRGTSAAGFASVGYFHRPWFMPELLLTRMKFRGTTIEIAKGAGGVTRVMSYPDASLTTLQVGFRYLVPGNLTWYDLTRRDYPPLILGPVPFAAFHAGLGYFAVTDGGYILEGARYEPLPRGNTAALVFVGGISLGVEVFQIVDVTAFSLELYYQFISGRSQPSTGFLHGLGLRMGLTFHF